MNALADRLAIAIHRNAPEHYHSVAVLRYALAIWLNTLFIMVASLLLGTLVNGLLPTIIAICSFAGLRMVTGGFHLHHAWACNIVSTLLLVLIPFTATFASSITFFTLNVISLLVIVLLAPRPDKNARLPLRLFPLLKIVATLVVGSNFIVQSDIMALAFFCQSITIILQWKEDKA